MTDRERNPEDPVHSEWIPRTGGAALEFDVENVEFDPARDWFKCTISSDGWSAGPAVFRVVPSPTVGADEP